MFDKLSDANEAYSKTYDKLNEVNAAYLHFKNAFLSLESEAAKPIPMLLWCPECRERHIDEGEFANKPHHTHACQHCGHVWRPAIVDTLGVRFLPGFKNETKHPAEFADPINARCKAAYNTFVNSFPENLPFGVVSDEKDMPELLINENGTVGPFKTIVVGSEEKGPILHIESIGCDNHDSFDPHCVECVACLQKDLGIETGKEQEQAE